MNVLPSPHDDRPIHPMRREPHIMRAICVGVAIGGLLVIAWIIGENL